MHVLTNSKKNYIDRIKYDFTQLKKGQLRARTHIRILNTNVVGEARKGGRGTTIFLNTFASFDIDRYLIERQIYTLCIQIL